MENLFTALIIVQFAVIVLHDWVDIRDWTHGSQVRAVVGQRGLQIATATNAFFPGLAVAFALWFFNRSKPWYVTDYWVLYCVVTVGSAIAMWYIPYLRGASEKVRREYAAMYSNTRHVLPPRGDNPRPNLLHICFHVLFVANLALALLLKFAT